MVKKRMEVRTKNRLTDVCMYRTYVQTNNYHIGLEGSTDLADRWRMDVCMYGQTDKRDKLQGITPCVDGWMERWMGSHVTYCKSGITNGKTGKSGITSEILFFRRNHGPFRF
jgi:hypothetical protein